jgi:hypothetical protein
MVFRELRPTPPTRPAPATTILDLRRLYGLHFAPGYGDNETLGHLLDNAGLNTLEGVP